jgi:phospholipase C
MPKDLSRVKTIVITMMENRSFDHILGYLGLPNSGHPLAARIEGIQHANLYYAHDPYPPRRLTNPSIDPDPPHEREDIAIQINSPVAGPMKGFVDSYRSHYPNADIGRVMEYCPNQYLSTTDFLARNFTICDNWFSCVPASTLPNRLMAASGYALVDHTPSGYLQIAQNLFHDNPDDLVYDWLEARGIGWRLYYSGSFFFMQMPRMLVKYEADVETQAIFRPIDRLIDDFQNGDVAQVVFIEPRYQDDFRRGAAQATDDHPPASVWGGQRHLKLVYDALTANPSVWGGLVGIVTYDEHGSFFDHVQPPRIATVAPPGAVYNQGFETLGVRVPGIIISPFVQPASLSESLFDHTSILKFLGEKFGGGNYTSLVDSRPVNNLSDVLDDQLLAPDAQVRAPASMD